MANKNKTLKLIRMNKVRATELAGYGTASIWWRVEPVRPPIVGGNVGRSAGCTLPQRSKNLQPMFR